MTYLHLHTVYQGHGGLPVHQAECVNLDEAGTVNEHLGTHVTQGDKLGSVLEPNVILFEDL